MALCRRISDLYALALLTVYALFLPLGGYERMMEGKYRAFLLLSLGYVLAMTALGAWKAVRWREPMCLAALAYSCSPRSARHSRPTARRCCSAAHGGTAF
ncbi:MAG: hypothetical protein ACLS8S_06840 [Oscillospiraceae bacterium]